MLVILSDIDGYFDSNPKENKNAKLFKTLDHIPAGALEAEHTPGDLFATGGIVTKLKAANFLLKQNKKMFLCSGFDLSAVKSFLINGEHNLGTLFTNDLHISNDN